MPAGAGGLDHGVGALGPRGSPPNGEETRKPATVGHAARRQAPLAYPTNLENRMHGSMGGERKPATVGHAARRQAPLAYPTSLSFGIEGVRPKQLHVRRHS